MKTLEEIQAPIAVAARARYEQDKGELQAALALLDEFKEKCSGLGAVARDIAVSAAMGLESQLDNDDARERESDLVTYRESVFSEQESLGFRLVEYRAVSETRTEHTRRSMWAWCDYRTGEVLSDVGYDDDQEIYASTVFADGWQSVEPLEGIVDDVLDEVRREVSKA